MRKTYLVLVLLLLAVGGIQAQELLNRSVFFETDDFRLTVETRALLDELIGQSDAWGDFHLEIQAHTDDRGNQWL